MEQKIFDKEDQCPCPARLDMEVSINKYAFLEDVYGKLDQDWEKVQLEDLECAYCLLKSAISYKSNKRELLICIKDKVATAFLEKLLTILRACNSKDK